MLYNDIDFNHKTILITGAAGFIGSNIVFYFQDNFKDANIVAVDCFQGVDKLSNGNQKSFGHYANLVGYTGIVLSGDINDENFLDKLSQNYKFDYIFHQAAISDTTANEQDLMIKTNTNAYESLLQIAIKHKANMIYASSGATYGDSDRFEVGYEKPNNVYGFSKVCMDNITKNYIKRGLDISVVGLRYFNVYGKNEFFKNKTSSMVLQFGLQILRGETPKLFEKSDKIKRDFVYIKDVVQANIKAAAPQKSGIYNVGTGVARSFESIVNILQKELNINNGKQYIKNPFENQYQYFTQANIQDTIKYLNYKPVFTLELGVKDYIKDIVS
ncbi:MAG: ADP-glyceromanno-heptose 6-epimerase [Epsilonproteobacteria bacterium]|nr:MAG: ADP-glyceromanno-heptose 6-epimerase [Campylobacterota bacterium]